MLQLEKITKIYPSGDVTALREVSLSFRRSDLLNAKVLGRLVKQVHDNLDAKAGKKAAKKD